MYSLLLLLYSLLTITCMWTALYKYYSKSYNSYFLAGLLNPSTTPSIVSGCSSPDIMFNILNFKYFELCEATRGFTNCLIGHGAFGSVFKANVRGCGPYAIKKLHNVS